MSSADHEQLLSQTSWVRDLARRLVRDPDLADDLAQEAWLAALRAPWSEVQSPRAWMATVLRRSLRERLRGDERRARREAERARDAVDECDPADVVARAGAHRNVVDAVMQLPEHYRLVVLRRYYDGDTPAQIAASTGIPVATVKTRLQRGLAQLRAALDRDGGGDGRAWAVALVPLLDRPAAAPPPLALPGGLASLTALATVVVLLAAVALREPPPQQPQPSAVATVDPGPESAGEPADREPPSGARRPAPAAAGIAGSAPRAVAGGLDLDAGARRALRVEVRDAAGRSVPDVLVSFEPDRGQGAAVVHSNADGLAQFTAAVLPGTVGVAGGPWTALRPVVVTEHSARRLTLLVAPRNSWRGRVVDEVGLAVPGATLAVELAEAAGPSAPLEPTVAPAAISDPAGRFVLEAPDAVGATLRVRAPGRAPLALPLAELGPSPWTVVVPALGPEAIRGRVVDGAGGPVVGARLALDGREVALAADGSFVLRAGAGELVAWAPAHTSARTGLAAGTSIAPELVLVAARSLTGTASRPDGSPAAGALVWDATAPPVIWDQDLGDVLWLVAQLNSVGGASPVEFAALGPSTVATGCAWEPVRADSNGRFELFGDPSRARRLVAFDPLSGAMGELAVGLGVTPRCDVVLDRPGLPAELDGRVLDLGRAPRVGARVQAQARVLAVPFGARRVEVGLATAPFTSTDRVGSFRLRTALPADHQLLVLDGGGLPSRVRLGPELLTSVAGSGGGVLRGLELFSRAAFAVDVAPGWPAGTQLSAFDAEGAPLSIAHRRGVHVEWWRAGLAASTVPRTLALSPRLAELRVERPGEAVRRLDVEGLVSPITLGPR